MVGVEMIDYTPRKGSGEGMGIKMYGSGVHGEVGLIHHIAPPITLPSPHSARKSPSTYPHPFLPYLLSQPSPLLDTHTVT